MQTISGLIRFRREYRYLILHEDFECQRKGDNKQKEGHEESDKSETDFSDHDHIDSKSWQTSEEEYQIQPGDEYGEGPHLPLPLLQVYKEQLMAYMPR